MFYLRPSASDVVSCTLFVCFLSFENWLEKVST